MSAPRDRRAPAGPFQDWVRARATEVEDLVLEHVQQAGSEFYAREIRDRLGGDVTVQAVTAALTRLRKRDLVVYEPARAANPPRRRQEAVWWPRALYDADTDAMRQIVGTINAPRSDGR